MIVQDFMIIQKVSEIGLHTHEPSLPTNPADSNPTVDGQLDSMDLSTRSREQAEEWVLSGERRAMRFARHLPMNFIVALFIWIFFG
jgi:hypothetical protein